MKETDIHFKLYQWAGPRASFHRIENSIISGFPDTIMCYGGLSYFIEFKIAIGWQAKFRRFQVSTGVKMMEHLAPRFHWIFVEKERKILLYKWRDLWQCCEHKAGPKQTVLINFKSLTPNHVISGQESFDRWLAILGV